MIYLPVVPSQTLFRFRLNKLVVYDILQRGVICIQIIKLNLVSGIFPKI